VTLEPLVAKLIIDCRSEDAVIRVDGEPVGGCPTVGDVAAGVHEITVTSPSSGQYTRTVDVGPGGEMTVSVTLAPKTAALPEGVKTEPSAIAEKNAPDKAAAESQSHKKKKILRIVGIASLAVGAGFGIMGGIFAAKASADVEDGDKLWRDMETADETGDDAAFNTARAEYVQIRNDNLPTHRALMIAGLAAGGVFLAGGTILLILRGRNEDPVKTDTVSFSPSGLTVRF
jgi:hypothetical protein